MVTGEASSEISEHHLDLNASMTPVHDFSSQGLLANEIPPAPKHKKPPTTFDVV